MVQKTNADSYLKKPYNELLNEAQELVKQPKVPPQLQASIQEPLITKEVPNPEPVSTSQNFERRLYPVKPKES